MKSKSKKKKGTKRKFQDGGQVGILPDTVNVKAATGGDIQNDLSSIMNNAGVEAPYAYKRGGRVRLRTRGTGMATKGLDFYGYK